MEHNDISNKTAYTIAVRYESMLLRTPKQKLWRRLIQKPDIDWSMAHRLRGLWDDGINVIIITFNPRQREGIEAILDRNGVTFSHVVAVKDVAELRHWLTQMECLYLDTDEDIIKHIYPWGELWKGAFV